MRKKFSPLKAAACSITGHNYKVSHVVNDRIQEICCANCNKQMTHNIYGDLVPLNDRYAQINRALNDMARKRQRAGVQVYS